VRRLSLALAATVASLAAGCGGGAHAPPGSTTHAAYGDPDGNGVLDRVPGERLADRTDLAPASRPVRRLATFAVFADAHVRDEESPARVPFLDRLGGPFHSTFRPQEALSGQVLAGVVRSLDRLSLQAVVDLGDLVDNAQSNEYDEALAILRGGRVHPDSGAPGYSGVQSASDPDPFYYRPDVDAPRHPGLLARAQRPFRSPGLRAPWFPLLGNHDILVQGEFRPTPAVRRLAVGSRRLVELSPALRLAGRTGVSAAEVEALLRAGLPGPTVRTAPDRRRAFVDPGRAMARLRAASGHGAVVGGRLDYAFDVGANVRGIALDVVRRDEGSRGLVDGAQLAWLRHQLTAAGRRRIVVFTHEPLASSTGGESVLRLLDRDRRVVAAVAGDTHRNRIEPRRSAGGGYWLVNTDSVADYPQQARAFSLVATAGGGVALETWLVDHADADGAGAARELSYLDAQGGRPLGYAGGRLDRNARLFLPRAG
jgi:hypothetical protein